MDFSRRAAKMEGPPAPAPSLAPNKRSKRKKKGGDPPTHQPPPPPRPDLPSEVPANDTEANQNSANEGDETDNNNPIDPEANMPSKGQRPQPRREADISVILTSAQRIELGTLVDSIMEKLIIQSSKPFDFLHLPVAQANRVKVWDYGPALEKTISMGEVVDGVVADGDKRLEKRVKNQIDLKPAKPIQKPNGDAQATPGQTSGETGADSKPKSQAPTPGPAHTEGYGDADDGDGPQARTYIFTQVNVDENIPGTVPAMSELQKDAASYCVKWRTTFQKRLNDLVVPKFPANPNAGPPSQGQGALRGGGAGVGAGLGGRGQQPQQGNVFHSLLRILLPSQQPSLL